MCSLQAHLMMHPPSTLLLRIAISLICRSYKCSGTSESIEGHLKKRLVDALNALNEHQVLRFDENLAVEPLPPSRILSKSMIR